MNGIRLGDLDVSDMVDIIHYFYEEDINYYTVEQGQMAEARRITIYRQFYDKEYGYASSSAAASGSNTASGPSQYDFDGNDLAPFDPTNAPVKPYVPPTEMDAGSYSTPFGDVLDAPVN